MKFIKNLLFAVIVITVSLHAEEKIRLDFKKTPIEDVIHFVAKETGLNILITGRISGKVDFISEKPISKKDLIPLLDEILRQKGYTIIPSTNGEYYLVTRAANAKKYSNVNKEGGMKTAILEVHHLRASEAVQKIRYLLSPFASISADNKKGVVILTDYPDRIEAVRKILSKIDRPMKKRVEFYPLKNASAPTAARELQNILKAMQGSFAYPVTVKGDEKSNQIIIIADENDIGRVLKIIENYDNHHTSYRLTSRVIYLNNAEAKATVKILSGLMKSFDKETRSKISFQAKEDINAIVLAGTKEAVDMIEKIIHKLDIEQQQVYVKAHIYEISKRKLENLGIKWGAVGGGIAGNTLLTGEINMGGSPFVLPSVLQGLLSTDNIEANVAVGAIIDLLKQNGAVNVISEPNVLCLNNKKSSVYIGKTISILTSTVQGNQTTDLARNTYSREDIGLTLEVKPQIASDNKVLMEVKAKLEDIDQASTKLADRPTTFKREVQTVAIVRNGENVIIGGLLKDYYSKGETKVPMLGDLPLLGPAFRSKNDIKDQINVIIVLTPYIVKDSGSLAAIQEKIAKAEKLKADLAMVLEHRLKEQKKLKKIKQQQKKFNDDPLYHQ